MDRRRVLAVGLALACSWATAACDVQVGKDGGLSFDVASARAQDTWTRSYSLESGGRLELINVNGRIVAEASAGSAVELVGERTARASSEDAARELLEKVEMREEVGPSQARVEVRAPRHFGRGGVQVQWTIKVPKGTVVDLRNTNGKVELNGLAGEVRAQTVNGGVEGRHLLVQTLDVSAVNGGVDVELAAPLASGGKVSLETVNGGVQLALPRDSAASVVARVTNGGIRTGDLPFTVTGEQNRRRFEGTLNGGGASVSLETTNGGIRLSEATGQSKSTS
jgi:Putative adhesin